MCALPTTPDFWEYDTVYLPKNPIIRQASMSLKEYEKIFFPQAKEDLLLDKAEAISWFLGDLVPIGEPVIGVGERDAYKTLLKFSDLPFAIRHGFRRGYAEPYEWLHNQFRDWASMFLSATLYYEEKDETMRELHRRALIAYSGVAPHYRVVLYSNAPTLKWDFHSLLQAIQLLLSVMLTDENKPLRDCPECNMAFYADDVRAVFCSKECKNRYNVRKSRRKQQED
jgi:predicted nucleic acid-binding Zn ribbon protein